MQATNAISVRGRQNPGLPTDKLSDALNAIEAAFTTKWLDSHKSHPLGMLWRRGDFLATNQLFWLGTAIDHLHAVNAEWIQHHVRRIKKGQRNERRGSMFEILGLDMFTANASVVPAPNSNPVIDGDVVLAGGPRLRISLKNFGQSDFQRDFQTEAREAETVFRVTARSTVGLWAGITALTESYPLADDWKALKSALADERLLRGPAGRWVDVAPNWMVCVNAPPIPATELSPHHLSYKFNIFAKHHNNESRNNINRIAKSCEDFETKLSSRQGDDVHVLLMRLTEFASISRCTDWVRQYVSGRERGLLDEIWLYQPAVAVDLQRDATSITHCMTASSIGGVAHPPLALTVPVGLISGSAPRNLLLAGAHQIDLDEFHWFQKGDIYQHFSLNANGTGSGTIKSLAPGVVTHAVMSHGGEHGVLSGIFPPSLDLNLFA